MYKRQGFYYIGPIDGHDLSSLIPILKNARDSKHDGPILVHIKTKKGKGYSFAEKAKDNYHGVSKFNVKTGEQSKSLSKIPPVTADLNKSSALPAFALNLFENADVINLIVSLKLK